MSAQQQIRTADRSAATVIYRNGSVYSPVDPFATALLVQDGRIRWVGQEAGADSLTDAHVHTVDLDGLLLTPSFAAAGPEPSEERGWLDLRRAGVHAVLDPQRGWVDAAGQRSPLPARVRRLGPQGPWIRRRPSRRRAIRCSCWPRRTHRSRADGSTWPGRA
ncbi:Uncharacterised protein [Rothia kristinae]|nr:Uncharacterised protein [Rothia kristinae]